MIALVLLTALVGFSSAQFQPQPSGRILESPNPALCAQSKFCTRARVSLLFIKISSNIQAIFKEVSLNAQNYDILCLIYEYFSLLESKGNSIVFRIISYCSIVYKLKTVNDQIIQ